MKIFTTIERDEIIISNINVDNTGVNISEVEKKYLTALESYVNDGLIGIKLNNQIAPKSQALRIIKGLKEL